MANGRATARLATDPNSVGAYLLRHAPGHLIRRAQQRAVDLFVDEVGEDGPTPRQFAVLLNVHQNDGINQTDLVRLSGIDRSTLTEILRRLVERGWITRRRMESDQRTNALSTTAAGDDVLIGAFDAMVRAQERILEPVPPHRREEAINLLALLAGDPEDE